MFAKLTPVRAYITTGVVAILVGGAVSAFCAKQPSTLAMWASAYLVLVMGVVQVFFGRAIEVLAEKIQGLWQWFVFGLFNLGSIVVILSTVLKYSENEQHVMVTGAGSLLIIAALLLLGWHLRSTRSSLWRTSIYAVIALLVCSIPLGLVLAHY